MAASIGDKGRMLPFVVGPRVVDVGAGGGELSCVLAAAGHRVTSLDNTPDAVRRLRALPQLEAVRECFADEVAELSTSADTIIASAVMHEVYSYGDSHGCGGWDAVTHTLEAFADVLAPGGRLIIRDGVMPDHPGRPASAAVPDDGLMRDYLARSPHPELALDRRADGRWWGTRHAVAEMLFTLTWGRDALAREAVERYQLATLDGYADLVGERFELLHASAVSQPEYRAHLADFAVEAEGEPGWFPATNAMWVFVRRH